MLDVSWRDPAVAAFFILPLSLAVTFVVGVWSAWQRTGSPGAHAWRAAAIAAAGTAIWLWVTWRAATIGSLRQWNAMPPPFGLLVVAILILAFRIAFSSTGTRLATGIPLWVLIGVQGFRLPLEIAMHGMYERGIMPVQMSYTGMNFDIVTGATALVVARLIATGRGGRRLAHAWNLLGLALLVNVVTIAILSTPRFGAFGEDHLNTWVTYPPFVWLPAVMVLAALTGHLVIFRALGARARAGVMS